MLRSKVSRSLLRLSVLAALCAFMTSCTTARWEQLDDYVGPAGSPSARQPARPAGRSYPFEPSAPATQAAAVPPQGPLEIAVQDAILLALENNRALSVQRLAPSIRRTYEEEERAKFDPTLGASLSALRERVRAESRTTGAMTDTRSTGTGAGAGITGFLPTGTELSVGLTTDRYWSDMYSDQHATRLGLTVTQALLRGAGLGVNLANLRQARLDTLSSQYELRGFTENLVAQVETTYWNYALAQRQIDIFQQSLDLAGQQLSETQERINVGKLAETELAAIQAEVALRREALINARSNLATIRLRLLRLLNPAAGNLMWTRDIVLKNLPAVPDVKLDDVESHAAVALRMRPDLNQARLGVERGNLEVIKTKNGLLPKMDLFISLGKTGYAESFGSSVGDIGGRSYDISAGITFEFPIGNRDAQSRHRRAAISRQEAEEAIENLAQLVELDVRSGYIEANRALEQIEATAATRRFQEEKLRAETEKFRVGKSTSLLVAQTQRDLVASQISEIQAVVNYLNSLVDLFRLEGSLLERRGISAPGRQPVDMSPQPDWRGDRESPDTEKQSLKRRSKHETSSGPGEPARNKP